MLCTQRYATLRNEGRSWAEICDGLGIPKGTAQRPFLACPKTCLNPLLQVADSSQRDP